ncbi:unnamed protein product [Closterium sp. Naga37s-1]|nr:unnamed protein product [Closterium sp. Naga37s-1]
MVAWSRRYWLENTPRLDIFPGESHPCYCCQATGNAACVEIGHRGPCREACREACREQCSALAASSASTPMTEELAERLKAYAERQARCINGVKDWPGFLSNPAKGLKDGVDASSVQECSYLYHLDPAYSGLGNQLLALVSSFTYALLTNRTLIINPHAQAALFLCDPFAFTPTPSTWMPMDSRTFA